MANKVDGTTVVVAALQESVAGLHEAVSASGETPEVDADQRLVLRDAVAGLDAVVEGVAPLLTADDVAPLRADLTWAAELLDPLVTADAAADLLDDLLDELDPALLNGPVSTRVSLADGERDRAAATAVTEMLRSPRWTTFVERADQLLIHPRIDERAGGKAGPVLTELVGVGDQALREALDAEQPGGLPRLVTRGRRLARLAEIARIAHGKHARRLGRLSLAVAEAAEDTEHAAAVERLLIDLADQAHRAGEPGFSYGRLHAAAEVRRELATAALDGAVAAWRKPKAHKWLSD